MPKLGNRQKSSIGAAWATLAVLCLSMNDVVIKFLSGGYALYEIVLFRSFIGLVVVLGVIVPLSGGLPTLRTKRLGIQILRGLCVTCANLCFFLGLAAMPLAEAVAIFFVSPLLIALGSNVFLGETVGSRRWSAIALGLLGVLLVLRPGSETFQIAALLPLAAAVFYAALGILTRAIGDTESAAGLVFYLQVTFLVVAVVFGLALGDGRYAGSSHPSLDFLLRAWVSPEASDIVYLLFLGVVSVIGAWAMGQAYRLSEAAMVAPIEYAAMPLAIVWGFLFFDEVPDLVALSGIGLILFAGLLLVLREREER